MTADHATILGIRFLDADVRAAIEAVSGGGLMVVPSGPGLATLTADSAYRSALAASDVAIVDSAYLVLLWLVLKRKRLHRVSGLGFLRELLSRDSLKPRGTLFLVNPSDEEGHVNLAWLQARGFDITAAQCYTAPIYPRGRIEDPRLKTILDDQRPSFVMLNVGGGIQEPLGLYLRQQLHYGPAILCTGAAIAFLTGRQARIPEWADGLGLGWLARCLRTPRRFVPRYLKAVGLARLVYLYGDTMPPLGGEVPGK